MVSVAVAPVPCSALREPPIGGLQVAPFQLYTAPVYRFATDTMDTYAGEIPAASAMSAVRNATAEEASQRGYWSKKYTK